MLRKNPTATPTDSLANKVIVKWDSKAKAHDKESIERIFAEVGAVETVHIKGSKGAIVCYHTVRAAAEAEAKEWPPEHAFTRVSIAAKKQGRGSSGGKKIPGPGLELEPLGAQEQMEALR